VTTDVSFLTYHDKGLNCCETPDRSVEFVNEDGTSSRLLNDVSRDLGAYSLSAHWTTIQSWRTKLAGDHVSAWKEKFWRVSAQANFTSSLVLHLMKPGRQLLVVHPLGFCRYIFIWVWKKASLIKTKTT